MIRAEIIKDSINNAGQRLTTFVTTYPRFIHAEHLRHRMHSFNSASSRAIPVKKMRENILAEPATPEWWGKNQSGMQAEAQLEGFENANARGLWGRGLELAAELHKDLETAGLHKQITNRVLEPWMHSTVLCSGTEWTNFFALRAHPATQPEFQVLAYRMLDCYLKSVPQQLDWGQWHIPFEDRMPEGIDLKTKLKIATARAARLSYLTFEGELNVEKDVALHDSLVSNGHMSPTEHCAFADPDVFKFPKSVAMLKPMLVSLVGESNWCDVLVSDQGNYKGFKQYRKLLPNENRTNADLKAIMAAKPEWVTL